MKFSIQLQNQTDISTQKILTKSRYLSRKYHDMKQKQLHEMTLRSTKIQFSKKSSQNGETTKDKVDLVPSLSRPSEPIRTDESKRETKRVIVPLLSQQISRHDSLDSSSEPKIFLRETKIQSKQNLKILPAQSKGVRAQKLSPKLILKQILKNDRSWRQVKVSEPEDDDLKGESIFSSQNLPANSKALQRLLSHRSGSSNLFRNEKFSLPLPEIQRRHNPYIRVQKSKSFLQNKKSVDSIRTKSVPRFSHPYQNL